MAKKRIKKILPRTNTGDIIEGFGPAGGVGGRTKVSNSITKKLGKDLTVNPKTVGPGKKLKARPNANFQQKLDEIHRHGTSIKNPDIPTSVSGKSNWKATDKIPTMFDISKTKPGSPQRGAVIKSANEAGVNKQGRVQIEGKYVNAPDVAQHKQILRERLRYKSEKINLAREKRKNSGAPVKPKKSTTTKVEEMKLDPKEKAKRVRAIAMEKRNYQVERNITAKELKGIKNKTARRKYHKENVASQPIPF